MAPTTPFLVCGRCRERLPAETLAEPLYYGMYTAMSATCARCGDGKPEISHRPGLMLHEAALVVLFDLAWRHQRAFHAVSDIVTGLQRGWGHFFGEEWPAHKNLTISVANSMSAKPQVFQRHSKVSLWAVRSPTTQFALSGDDDARRALLQGLEAEAAAESGAGEARLQAQRRVRKSRLEARQQKRQRLECGPPPDRHRTPEALQNEVKTEPQRDVSNPQVEVAVEDPSAGQRAAQAALATDRDCDEAQAGQQETAARLAAVERQLAQLQRCLEEQAGTQQQLAATQRQLIEVTARLTASAEQLSETARRLTETEALLRKETERPRAAEEKLVEEATSTGGQDTDCMSIKAKSEGYLLEDLADGMKPDEWDADCMSVKAKSEGYLLEDLADGMKPDEWGCQSLPASPNPAPVPAAPAQAPPVPPLLPVSDVELQTSAAAWNAFWRLPAGSVGVGWRFLPPLVDVKEFLLVERPHFPPGGDLSAPLALRPTPRQMALLRDPQMRVWIGEFTAADCRFKRWNIFTHFVVNGLQLGWDSYRPQTWSRKHHHGPILVDLLAAGARLSDLELIEIQLRKDLQGYRSIQKQNDCNYSVDNIVLCMGHELQPNDFLSQKLNELPRAQYHAEDDGLTCTWYNLNLKDPMTFTRINHPVRGRDCEHLACCDLATLLRQSREMRNSFEWACGICQRPMAGLVYDPEVRALLQRHPALTEIKVDLSRWGQPGYVPDPHQAPPR